MSREFSVDETWQRRPCPACQTDEACILFRKEGVPFVRCRRCSTAYVQAIPPERLLHSIYDDLGVTYSRDPARVAIDFDRRRYSREIEAIPLAARCGRLLDVGCATGSFLVRALEIGFAEVRGIDISASAVEYANERIGQDAAIVGDFPKAMFEPESCDVVTMWQTLEHLPTPAAFAAQAYSVLKPRGVLCLSVPHGNGISMRILRERWRYVGLEHLNYFTKCGLTLLITGAGFSIRGIRVSNFNPITFWKDLLGHHVRGGFSSQYLIADGQRTTTLRRKPFVRLIERFADPVVDRLGVGDLLIVTAVKG